MKLFFLCRPKQLGVEGLPVVMIQVPTQKDLSSGNRTDVVKQLTKLSKLFLGFLTSIHEVFQSRDFPHLPRMSLRKREQIGLADIGRWDLVIVIDAYRIRSLTSSLANE